MPLTTTSYVDVAEANEYFAERLESDAWTAAASVSGKQLASLKQATRMINQLNFVGRKAEDIQENEFPRDDETTIPREVKMATCEIAIALLRKVSLQTTSQTVGLTSKSVGDASQSFADSTAGMSIFSIAGNTNSMEAYRLLRPWLYPSTQVDLIRV